MPHRESQTKCPPSPSSTAPTTGPHQISSLPLNPLGHVEGALGFALRWTHREIHPLPFTEMKHFRITVRPLRFRLSPLCAHHDFLPYILSLTVRVAKEDEKEAYQGLTVGAKTEGDYGKSHTRRQRHHCEEKYVPKKEFRGESCLAFSETQTLITESLL